MWCSAEGEGDGPSPGRFHSWDDQSVLHMESSLRKTVEEISAAGGGEPVRDTTVARAVQLLKPR